MMWFKVSRKERKALVVSKLIKINEGFYKITAVILHQQGNWTVWDVVIEPSRVNMRKLISARLSFLISATYDTLPPWKGVICGTPSVNYTMTIGGRGQLFLQGVKRTQFSACVCLS